MFNKALTIPQSVKALPMVTLHVNGDILKSNVTFLNDRCCYGDKDGIYCGDDYNATWNEFQVVPYYVGIVFFCFFPKLNSPSNIPETDIGLLFLRNSHSSWLSSKFLYSLI
jgi:hypothetical protein